MLGVWPCFLVLEGQTSTERYTQGPFLWHWQLFKSFLGCLLASIASTTLNYGLTPYRQYVRKIILSHLRIYWYTCVCHQWLCRSNFWRTLYVPILRLLFLVGSCNQGKDSTRLRPKIISLGCQFCIKWSEMWIKNILNSAVVGTNWTIKLRKFKQKNVQEALEEQIWSRRGILSR